MWKGRGLQCGLFLLARVDNRDVCLRLLARVDSRDGYPTLIAPFGAGGQPAVLPILSLCSPLWYHPSWYWCARSDRIATCWSWLLAGLKAFEKQFIRDGVVDGARLREAKAAGGGFSGDALIQLGFAEAESVYQSLARFCEMRYLSLGVSLSGRASCN